MLLSAIFSAVKSYCSNHAGGIPGGLPGGGSIGHTLQNKDELVRCSVKLCLRLKSNRRSLFFIGISDK